MIPFTDILEGINRSLRDRVLPELEAKSARTQVVAIINMLETLAIRADFKPELVLEQLALQADLCATLSDLLADTPDAPEGLPCPKVPETPSLEALTEMRNANELQITAILHWAQEPGGNTEAKAKVRAATLVSLKAQNAVDWRNMAGQALAEMSEGE